MNAETNTTDPRIEVAAEELAKNDGWLSLKHPSPATQKTLREHAAVVIATIDAVDPRKPRTITTVEELDALPMGAAILDTRRAVWVNDGDTVAPWASLGEGNLEGGPIWVSAEDITLPATVLYTPEAAE